MKKYCKITSNLLVNGIVTMALGWLKLVVHVPGLLNEFRAVPASRLPSAPKRRPELRSEKTWKNWKTGRH